MFTLKYPEDFRSAKDNDGILLVSQKISATSQFELSGSVQF